VLGTLGRPAHSGVMNQNRSPEHDRVRVVAGSHNVRDLGGLTTSDGRTVRRGRVFRSDYPAFAELDESAVRALGLRSVVDLRRAAEASFECVSWEDHGVAYHRCPLSGGAKSSWDAPYQAYLSHRPETVVEAVRQVTAVEGHPVLFHCAAGKDRTGTVAALVLSVLGVAEEDIVADYVLTEEGLAPIMERLATVGPYVDMLRGSTYDDHLPRAEHMRTFLQWLAEEQGGASRWLTDHGLDADRLDAFRDAMLRR
jgi:protein-tyrosine phosphatase